MLCTLRDCCCIRDRKYLSTKLMRMGPKSAKTSCFQTLPRWQTSSRAAYRCVSVLHEQAALAVSKVAQLCQSIMLVAISCLVRQKVS